MGARFADELAMAWREGVLRIETALTEHLRSNIYPPVPLAFIPTAVKAVQLGNELPSDRWDDTIISAPSGWSTNGRTEMPLGFWIETLYLMEFIGGENGY